MSILTVWTLVGIRTRQVPLPCYIIHLYLLNILLQFQTYHMDISLQVLLKEVYLYTSSGKILDRTLITLIDPIVKIKTNSFRNSLYHLIYIKTFEKEPPLKFLSLR